MRDYQHGRKEQGRCISNQVEMIMQVYGGMAIIAVLYY